MYYKRSKDMSCKEKLLNMKKELGLENMTDEEILRYALKCSQEIKYDLASRDDRLLYSNLINVLSKSDEVILNETIRIKKYNNKGMNYKDIWSNEVENIQFVHKYKNEQKYVQKLIYERIVDIFDQ